MKKNVSTQAGFSLIELMVVVGIIGILAAVAVPQFSKFQAKARQSEIKTNLAALYTSEKGFYTEYSTYTADLKNAGFGVEGTRLRYDLGFDSALLTCYAAAAGLPVEAGAVTNNHAMGANVNTGGATWAAAFTQPGAGTACTSSTFTALGWGDPNSTPVVGAADRWTVDEHKNLVNTVNGIN